MWEGLTEDTKVTLLAQPDPPEDAEAGLADPTWRLLFLEYVSVNGADAAVVNSIVVLEAMANGQDDLLALFSMVNTEGTHPVPLSDELYPSLAFPSPGAHDYIMFDLKNELVATAATWWWAFRDEAVRIRHWEARTDLVDEWMSHVDENTTEQTIADTQGMPVHSTMSLDDIDRDYCDRLNEYELKELGEGDRVAFRQFEDVVMLGDNYPPAYLTAMDNAGTRSRTPTGGLITMVAKGSTFSAGKISVSYTSPQPDPDNMKAALKRVTKKSISFA